MSTDLAAQIREQADLLDMAVNQLLQREEARDRLSRDMAKNAAQIGRSASLLLQEEHLVAYNILLRAITESMIRLAWGLRSEDNALSLEKSAHQEFRRNLVSLIKKGILSIQDSKDGTSLDHEVIDRAEIDRNHKPTNLRDMAKSLGLEEFYQLLYKPLSMQTHGTLNVVAAAVPGTTLEGRAKAILAGIGAIKILSLKWLALQQLIAPEDLAAYLLPRVQT